MLWLLSWLGWGLACLLVALWLWKEITLGVYSGNKRLDGKTAVITGGNAGIGFETALDLAARGAQVVLGCRDLGRGDQAVKQIIKQTGNKKVEVIKLNLASFKGVREFAKEAGDKLDKIDILVNNAGIPPLGGDRLLSEDDYDLVLQTNHFSHFLLTNLLKDLMSKSDSPRIINVSSAAQKRVGPSRDSEIDFASIKPRQPYEIAFCYGVSKLMNSLFSQEIARRWAAQGFLSFSLHPGVVRTTLLSNAETPPWFKAQPKFLQSLEMGLAMLVGLIYGKSAKQGAQTSIYCCLEDGLKNGEYYSDCKIAPGYFKNPGIYDAKWAADLWDHSVRVVKL